MSVTVVMNTPGWGEAPAEGGCPEQPVFVVEASCGSDTVPRRKGPSIDPQPLCGGGTPRRRELWPGPPQPAWQQVQQPRPACVPSREGGGSSNGTLLQATLGRPRAGHRAPPCRGGRHIVAASWWHPAWQGLRLNTQRHARNPDLCSTPTGWLRGNLRVLATPYVATATPTRSGSPAVRLTV